MARGSTRSAQQPVSTAPISADAQFSENQTFQEFLDTCCELHADAWSRASDLWQAYVAWAQTRLERFPLTRRAFAEHLKARGLRADRTKAARIWRGIALMPVAAVTQ